MRLGRSVLRPFPAVVLATALTAAAGPATAVQTPAIFLEVTDVGAPSCASVLASPDEIPTSVELPPNGSGEYTVYLLGAADIDPPWPGRYGLTGFRMGIEYTASSGPDHGMAVLQWTRCSVYEFTPPDWPASGSGNTITWSTTPNTCQRQDVVIAGFFQVAVYGASTMSVTEYFAEDEATVADCSGAEIVIEIPVETARMGWVSFGGGAKGTDGDGCNPLVERCNQNLTPVEPTTWGRLKQAYR